MKLKGPKRTRENAKRLRRELSLPEVLLWQQLRRTPNGYRFRRQQPASDYVLDFYCAPARVAIEVDGEVHDRGDRPARDVLRDAWLDEQGVLVLRIPATAILTDLDAVLRHVLDTIERCLPPPPPC